MPYCYIPLFLNPGPTFEGCLENYTALSKQLKNELEKISICFSVTDINKALEALEYQLHYRYSAGELGSSCISIITLHEKLLEILIYACKNNNAAVTQAILKDELFIDPWYHNIENIVLKLSIKNKLYNTLEEILALNYIDWPEEYLGISAIDAVTGEDTDMARILVCSGVVSALIATGVDYAANDYGLQLLFLAIYYEQKELLKIMLNDIINKKISPNDTFHFNVGSHSRDHLLNNKYYTPLTIACTLGVNNNFACIDLLLCCAQVDINTMTQFGQSALTVAAARGSKALVRKLLNHGSMIKEKGDQGLRALHYAVKSGSNSTASYLLGSGIGENHNKLVSLTSTVPIEEYNGEEDLYETTLMVAVAAKNTEVVKLLLKPPYNGAHINDTNEYGLITCLVIAAKHGGNETINLLITSEYYIDEFTHDGTTYSQKQLALHQAVYSNKKSTVSLLCKLGANINAIIDLSYLNGIFENEVGTPLWLAARTGPDLSEMLSFLLEIPNINPNLYDVAESPPLIKAIIFGNTEMVEKILSHKHLKLDTTMPLGDDAFDSALLSTSMLKLLLEDERFDPNKHASCDTNTGLILACSAIITDRSTKRDQEEEHRHIIKTIHIMLESDRVNRIGALMYVVSNLPYSGDYVESHYLQVIGILLRDKKVEELTTDQLASLPLARHNLYCRASNMMLALDKRTIEFINNTLKLYYTPPLEYELVTLAMEEGFIEQYGHYYSYYNSDSGYHIILGRSIDSTCDYLRSNIGLCEKLDTLLRERLSSNGGDTKVEITPAELKLRWGKRQHDFFRETKEAFAKSQAKPLSLR